MRPLVEGWENLLNLAGCLVLDIVFENCWSFKVPYQMIDVAHKSFTMLMYMYQAHSTFLAPSHT